jgi:hypothetical protein
LEVANLVTAVSPLWFAFLPRSKGEQEPVHIDALDPASCIWKATVTYAKSNRQDKSQPSWNMSTTGGTSHVTRCLGTRDACGEVSRDLAYCVGFDGENINGVDITSPICSYAETRYLPWQLATSGYRNTLYWLTGKVNGHPWRNYAAGEALFLGAEASQKGPYEDVEITYKFAGSPNDPNVWITPRLGPMMKFGWDYIDVAYDERVDSATQKIVKGPVAAYVRVLYAPANFYLLGIGG